MNRTIAIISTFICVLIAGAVFIYSCTDIDITDSEDQTLIESDIAGETLAKRTPPVTGDPAFIQDPEDPALEWGPCPPFMPEGCELAIIQGDPEDLNADALLRLPPNSTIDHHWHTSSERMVLLAGEMEVDYDGQEPVNLEPGTYAYGPAGLAHVAHCTSEEDECILFIAFEDPVDAIAVVDEEAPGSEEEAFIVDADEIAFGNCPPFMPEGCGLGVLQGDPEEHNADVLFRLAPNTTVPMHWHTSAERMVLLSGELRVNYQGQRPVVFSPYTYAYGPAKLPHETRCLGQDDCLLFIAFEEPVDAIDVRGGNLPHR